MNSLSWLSVVSFVWVLTQMAGGRTHAGGSLNKSCLSWDTDVFVREKVVLIKGDGQNGQIEVQMTESEVTHQLTGIFSFLKMRNEEARKVWHFVLFSSHIREKNPPFSLFFSLFLFGFAFFFLLVFFSYFFFAFCFSSFWVTLHH